MNKATSYTSASGSIPTKILLDEGLMRSIVRSKFIMPAHVQLNPTNKCGLDCEWCSCSAVDRNLSLSMREVEQVMTQYKRHGCRSATITGGGEPLMHRDIKEMISMIQSLGIAVGLVTNGWHVMNLSNDVWNRIRWVRVSLGDGREKEKSNDGYWGRLESLSSCAVDLSFSYVLTDDPDYDLITRTVDFARKVSATHVRIVTDIVARSSKSLSDVRKYLGWEHGDLVIYQDRSRWTKGQKDCYISLLKPVVGADGQVYPCCGAQYFTDVPARKYLGSMGAIDDIDRIQSNQIAYDGSGCAVCYYSSYNRLLGKLLSHVEHKEFV